MPELVLREACNYPGVRAGVKPPTKGSVEKPVIEELEFVGTGLVLQDESFRMNPSG
jgi:hypothetical protein